MDEQRKRGLAWGAGLVAAGAFAGIVLAAALPAGAQTTPSPSATTQQQDPSKATHPGETLLTGTNAEKARAAALKAVPGATVERVETDSDGDAYEAHVRRADGTRAVVKMDKAFTVLRVEECDGRHADPA